MIKFIETVNYYKDTWDITFYFVVAVALIIGILWTVIKLNKNEKKALTENIIYNHSEDLIEQYEPNKKKSRESDTYNNYVIQNHNENDTVNYYDIKEEKNDISNPIKEVNNNFNKQKNNYNYKKNYNNKNNNNNNKNKKTI